jgi:tRNA threonylcarbamoyladenosine biosynthesis protein TsaB
LEKKAEGSGFDIKKILAEDLNLPAKSVLFDTSGDYLIAALKGDDDAPVFAAEVFGPRKQQELIFQILEELQKEACLEGAFLPELVVCGKGPGAYTSIRVGVSAARAIAQASGSKVVAVDSLEVIAASYYLLNSCAIGKAAVVRDAKMNQVYFLGVSITDRLSIEGSSSVLSYEQAYERLKSESYHLILTDTPAVSERFKGFEFVNQNPHAIGLIERAVHHLEEGRLISWKQLLPEYLRLSYAEQKRAGI